MMSDTALRCAGMKLLAENLGELEAERFIFLMNSDRFDYTEWQRDLFEDMTLHELGEKAMQFQRDKYGTYEAGA
jgi:hypothetical protein